MTRHCIHQESATALIRVYISYAAVAGLLAFLSCESAFGLLVPTDGIERWKTRPRSSPSIDQVTTP